MKKKMTKTICCTVSALTITAAVAGSALAAPVSDNKCGGKNMAVANVESELLIRKDASENATVVGYLPSAAGVLVESMNEEWTKVKSGEVSGYVKTDYLAFGDKAEELKNVYGVAGAVASWNDVKVFADHEDTSSIIGSIDEGEGFEVLGSTDNWVEVQLASGDVGYVAAEDVEMTAVLDTAIATDAYTAPAAQTATVQETVPAETESYVETAADETYIEDVYTEEVYYPETEQYVETESYVETEQYVETESYVETEQYIETESYVEPETETYVETDSYEEEGSYDDAEEYVEDTYMEDENDGITGDEYIDPETEASGSEVNADDAALLAALIYCEAGNQSEEGKVAVGQVVMNRVASDSFADSISGVIYESGQFTPAMTGWLDQVLASGETPSECYDAAVAALNGEGTVGDALYFNAGSGKGQQIGDHQFY